MAITGSIATAVAAEWSTSRKLPAVDGVMVAEGSIIRNSTPPEVVLLKTNGDDIVSASQIFPTYLHFARYPGPRWLRPRSRWRVTSQRFALLCPGNVYLIGHKTRPISDRRLRQILQPRWTNSDVLHLHPAARVQRGDRSARVAEGRTQFALGDDPNDFFSASIVLFRSRRAIIATAGWASLNTP